MSYIYAHLPEGEDIGPDARSYAVTEGLLDYKGRRILYLYVVASGVSFCDRNYAPHMASVNVKGEVVRWKYGRNEAGETLSEIEPITGDAERAEIGRLLRATYNVSTASFM